MVRIIKISGLIPLLLLLTSCDAYTSVQGRIQGPDCQPIVGATVEIRIDGNLGPKTESDSTGRFEIGRVHGKAREIQIVVSKDGYKDESVGFHPNYQYKDIIIELEPHA